MPRSQCKNAGTSEGYGESMPKYADNILLWESIFRPFGPSFNYKGNLYCSRKNKSSA